MIQYKPLLDEAIRLSKFKVRLPTLRRASTPLQPHATIVLQRAHSRARLQAGRDLDWHEAVATLGQPAAPLNVLATDPLYVIYTSGTTGQPKGIVRDNGGHAVALHWAFENLFGMGPNDVWWAASDIGWTVRAACIENVRTHCLAGWTLAQRVRPLAGRRDHRLLRGQAKWGP